MTLRMCGLGALLLSGLIVVACSEETTDGGGGSGNTGNTGVGGSGNSGNTGGSGNSGNTGGSGGAGNTGGGTAAECGDGVRNGDELCDGEDFGTSTCADFGSYDQGNLWCSLDCMVIDDTGCYTAGTTCGDGTEDGVFEPCDGDVSMTCEQMGYTGGTMACADNCQVDVSGCEGDLCDGLGWYDDEGCDPCELLGGTADPACEGCGADGTCVSYIFDGFVSAMSTCLYLTGAEDPDCGTCGDGTQDPTERCDGDEFGAAADSCESIGYTGGTLACDSNCHLDPTDCT